MSTPTRLVVVSAGLSDPSSTRLLADRLAEATVTALEARAGGPADDRAVEVTRVELRDLAHDLTDALLTGFHPPAVEAAARAMAQADAVVVATPVFSASYSGLFKTFFDVLEPGTLERTPVLLAATAGTPRHSLVLEHALRPLFSYLHATVVPTAVFAATDDFGDRGLQERVEQAAGELAALARPGLAGTAAPAGLQRTRPGDGFAEPVPFDQLLLRASGR